MSKLIYPEVEIRETSNSLSMRTTLRKEHNGKWYLWEFFKDWHYAEGNEERKRKSIEIFHQEVYFTLVCGKVSEDLTDMYGNPIFKEDEAQISEFDRIRQLLHI